MPLQVEVVYPSLLSMNRGLDLRRHSAQVKLYCTENICTIVTRLWAPSFIPTVPFLVLTGTSDWPLVNPTVPEGLRRLNRNYYYVDGSPREPVVRFGSPTDLHTRLDL